MPMLGGWGVRLGAMLEWSLELCLYKAWNYRGWKYRRA